MRSLNVSTGQWDELPPLSTERHGATLRVVDGRLFVVGRHTASMEEYLLLERRWVSVPDMPRVVYAANAVALEGKLLVIEGRDLRGGFLSAVHEYDLGDRRWEELPSLLTARSHCAVTVLGGDVVVMGGEGITSRGPTILLGNDSI